MAIRLLLLCFVFAIHVDVMEAQANEKKEVSGKNDIFFFKVDKEFQGGEVSIYNDKNELLEKARVVFTKMMFDFYDLKPGKYTIRLTKDKLSKEFVYEKEPE